MHNLKVSDIQRGEGLGLVKDSVQLTEMERILQRFDARDNRVDRGMIAMKPGTNRLVQKARLRSAISTI